jgi:protein-tyrosine-phosphatase
MNILVLCTGNSARSIMLEAILQAYGNGRVKAYSAGSDAVGRVNPYALRLLQKLGYDTRDYRSKSWDVFAGPNAPVMDAVITVCGGARDTTCPMWPGAPVTAHWGIEDPAAVTGTDQEIEAAFQEAYGLLLSKAQAFLSQPFETLAKDDKHKVLTEAANG